MAYFLHVIRSDIRAMPEERLIHPDSIFNISAISNSYNHWKGIKQAIEHIFLSNERVDYACICKFPKLRAYSLNFSSASKIKFGTDIVNIKAVVILYPNGTL